MKKETVKKTVRRITDLAVSEQKSYLFISSFTSSILRNF